jgi:hypothetical protein
MFGWDDVELVTAMYTKSPTELVRSAVNHLTLNAHGNVVAYLLVPLLMIFYDGSKKRT